MSRSRKPITKRKIKRKSSSRIIRRFLLFSILLLVIIFSLYIAIGKSDSKQKVASVSSESSEIIVVDDKIVQNQYLRIWHERVYQGILDIYYPNEEDWVQYNNIIPIAKVDGVWNNAEIDHSSITREILTINGEKVVRYQFSPFPNGAHFYLDVYFKKDVLEIKVTPNQDSKSIEAFSLGNYFGLADAVRYIKINNIVYDATTYPKPDPDGNYQPGSFILLPYPHDKKIEFWGKSGYIQTQETPDVLGESDEVVAEVRRTPWLPTQENPGRNWFETVHITRSPFNESRNIWRFSYKKPAIGRLRFFPTPSDLYATYTITGVTNPNYSKTIITTAESPKPSIGLRVGEYTVSIKHDYENKEFKGQIAKPITNSRKVIIREDKILYLFIDFYNRTVQYRYCYYAELCRL